ncbi:hypothetical protein [Methanosarcina sp.]|uniref:hypothetical protein n=1 Tax=Methanosarcina sp. TaxID=2213 RepID=UPI002AB81A77|nr:hypothetical protein [Methanosarcina sp.]MDY9927107.1 hypothetical protein [Methanosarcina sp.]
MKILAARFAGKHELLIENTGKFLLEVDRLKSHGQFSDAEILISAYTKILELKNALKVCPTGKKHDPDNQSVGFGDTNYFLC